jgi:hypothetical protein
MNTNPIIDSIKSKLNSGNYSSEVRSIDEYVATEDKGGEMLGTVGRFLVDLQFNDPQAYYLIEDDIEQYLTYCQKQGIIIL